MALFDQLSSMFGGVAVPGSMAQKIGLMGSPLISALLAKHGHAPPPEAGADAGAAVADVADSKVGPDLGDPAAKAANVLGGLGSFDAPDTGSINDALPGVDTGKDSIFGAAGMDPIKAALGANAAKPRNGFLDRIGDFLHSDEGRAALLRSGAATLQGGLGAGIKAGTDFVDQRRHERAAGAAEDRKFGLEERRADNEDAWHMGQLDSQAEQNRTTREHYGRMDENQAYGTDSENYRARLHEHGETGREGMRQGGENQRTGARIAEDNFEHVNPSGSVQAQQAGETARNTQDNQASILNVLNQHRPTMSLRTHYTTTPERLAAEGPRLRPSQVKPAEAGGAKQISSDAEYNALPSGARFVGPDGQVRIKP